MKNENAHKQLKRIKLYQVHKNDEIKIWCDFQVSMVIIVFGLQQNEKIVPWKFKRISNIEKNLNSIDHKSLIWPFDKHLSVW